VIKNYLRSIYDKTGVSDRLELALFTIHHRVLAQAAAEVGSKIDSEDRLSPSPSHSDERACLGKPCPNIGQCHIRVIGSSGLGRTQSKVEILRRFETAWTTIPRMPIASRHATRVVRRREIMPDQYRAPANPDPLPDGPARLPESGSACSA